MTYQPDELAELLKRSEANQTTFEHNLTYHRSTAKDLLAAGYYRPRTITTLDELDALPDGAVILDEDNDVSRRRGGLWCGHETAALTSVRMAKFLPAAVLLEPLS